MAPIAMVFGRIVDPQGRPVPAADVCASAFEGERLSWADPSCTRSDAQGRYGVPVLPWTAVAIDASAPNYAPGRHGDGRAPLMLEPTERRQGVDVVLDRDAVPVQGVVEDLGGGPIEGALVRFHGSTSGPSFARSDADGRFSAFVRPGEFEVTAIAPGYAAGATVGPAPGFDFEIRLAPASEISGIVVGEDGRTAVAGARVRALAVEMVANIIVPFGTTDDEGRFSIDGLSPGNYSLVAVAPHGRGQSNGAVGVGFAQHVHGVVVEVRTGASIRGQVRVGSAEGAICPEGTVGLADASGGISAPIDDRGGVSFDGVPAGAYQVSIDCALAPLQVVPETLVVPDGAAELEPRWHLSQGHTLHGMVVDDRDRPIASATIAVSPVDGPGTREASSDASGAFTVQGLGSGPHELFATAEGSVPMERMAAVDVPGADPVRVVLQTAGAVEGRVLDGRGLPVAGVRVRARGDARESPIATTDDDGRYSLPAVSPGVVRLEVGRGWEQIVPLLEPAEVVVRAGALVHRDLRVAAQDGKVRGSVVDARGRPVSDAFVRLIAGGSEASSLADAHMPLSDAIVTLTDAQGEFEFDLLLRDAYLVVAERRATGEVGTLRTSTERRGPIEVQLAAPTRIEARVVAGDGAAIPEFEVIVMSTTIGYLRNETIRDPHGRLVLRGVPPGQYALAVQAAGGSAYAELELRSGDDVRGLVFTIEPR